jgi:hypothetical protein
MINKIKLLRKPNTFEAILLIIGLLVLISGFYLITTAVKSGSTSGLMVVQTIFLWLILVALIILVAVSENIKEEMKEILTTEFEKREKK